MPDPSGVDWLRPSLLTVADVVIRARAVGRTIAPSTWRAYVSRHQAPQPVTRVGREPLWDVEMVEEWLVGRRKSCTCGVCPQRSPTPR
jgi:hypothetical protein